MAKILHVDVESLIGWPWQLAPNGERSIESIVDLVGIRLGMNCGRLLPLMPTTEPLWLLFAQVVVLCFRL
jgi:hypothetical protein